jgi:hypothetical protein
MCLGSGHPSGWFLGEKQTVANAKREAHDRNVGAPTWVVTTLGCFVDVFQRKGVAGPGMRMYRNRKEIKERWPEN